MKEINLPPFYVGQKVVSLKGTSSDYIQKGTIYSIKGIMQLVCGCWCVDVGINIGKQYMRCGIHNTEKILSKGIRWIDHSFFAPIQENFQSISLEKVLEEETKLIGVN